MPILMAGDLLPGTKILLDFTLGLVAAAQTDPDPVTRQKCLMLAYDTTQFSELLLLHPSFTWDGVYGVRGATLIEAARAYSYDPWHYFLNRVLSSDFLHANLGTCFPLAVHWGDIPNALENLDMALENVALMCNDRGISRGVRLPKPTASCSALLRLFVHTTGLDDRREAVAAMLSACNFSLSTIDAKVDAMASYILWMRPRGDQQWTSITTLPNG